MNFYLVSRVADDKNFFVDLIYAVFQVKSSYSIEVNLTFVGAIESEALHRTLLRLIQVLELDKQIKFTKRSIRYEEMDDVMKGGYFINLSINDFVGYSGIECLMHRLKTVFYNVDKNYIGWPLAYRQSFCQDYVSLVELFNKINKKKEFFDRELALENTSLLKEYKLTDSESELLRSLM